MTITTPHHILHAFRGLLDYDGPERIRHLGVHPVNAETVRLFATNGIAMATTLADLEGRLPKGALAIPAAILPDSPAEGLPPTHARIEHRGKKNEPDVISVTWGGVTRAAHMPEPRLPKITKLVEQLDAPPVEITATEFSAAKIAQLSTAMMTAIPYLDHHRVTVAFLDHKEGHLMRLTAHTKPYPVHGMVCGLHP